MAKKVGSKPTPRPARRKEEPAETAGRALKGKALPELAEALRRLPRGADPVDPEARRALDRDMGREARIERHLRTLVQALPRAEPRAEPRADKRQSLYEKALRANPPDPGEHKSEWAGRMSERLDRSAGAVANWLSSQEGDDLWRELGGLPTSGKMKRR